MTRFQCRVLFYVFALSNLIASGQMFADEYLDDMMLTTRMRNGMRQLQQPYDPHRCKPRESSCRSNIECCTKRCVQIGAYKNERKCKPEGHYEWNDEEDRIIEGELVTYGEIPSIVTIEYKGEHVCGGTILNQYYILTAAHCFKRSLNPSDYIAVSGTLKAYHVKFNINNNPWGRTQRRWTNHTISQITHFERYQAPKDGHDISLLRTSVPIEFIPGYVEPIELARYAEDDLYCASATAWGWGKTTPRGNPNDDLLKVQLPKVDINTCSRKLATRVQIFPTSQLCYGSGIKDTCGGDSGGPLTCTTNNKFKQIGVVSYGYGCTSTIYPGVYTRVAAYYDWIHSTMTNYS